MIEMILTSQLLLANSPTFVRLTERNYQQVKAMMVDSNPYDDRGIVVSLSQVSGVLGSPKVCDQDRATKVCTWRETLPNGRTRVIKVIWNLVKGSDTIRTWYGEGF